MKMEQEKTYAARKLLYEGAKEAVPKHTHTTHAVRYMETPIHTQNQNPNPLSPCEVREVASAALEK